MFKKKISDLLPQEIEMLISNNEEIAKDIYDYAIESGTFWLEEYLDGFPRNIGSYQFTPGGWYDDHFRLSIDSYGELMTFREWFKSTQEAFCLVSDEEAKTVEEYINTWITCDHVSDLFWYGYSYHTGQDGRAKEKDLHNLEAKVKALQEEVEGIYYNRLSLEYGYFEEKEHLIEYFDVWLDNKEACGSIDLYTNAAMDGIYEYIPEEYIPARTIKEHLTPIM